MEGPVLGKSSRSPRISRPESIEKETFVPVAPMSQAKCAVGAECLQGKLVVCGKSISVILLSLWKVDFFNRLSLMMSQLLSVIMPITRPRISPAMLLKINTIFISKGHLTYTVNIRKPNVRLSYSAKIRTIDRSN